MKTCAILTVCFCVVAYGGFAKTIRVPGDYRFIKEAIDAAQPGDEILIDSGLHNAVGGSAIPGYEEDLVIDKSVTLRGMGVDETRLRNVPQGRLLHPWTEILIDSDHPIEVRIIDLTLGPHVNNRTFPISVEGEAGIELQNVQMVLCTLSVSDLAKARITSSLLDSGECVSLRGRAEMSVESSDVQDMPFFAGDNSVLHIANSSFSYASAAWVRMQDEAVAKITNTTFSDSEGGLVFRGGAAVVETCRFIENSAAVVVEEGAKGIVTVTDSTFFKNGIGLVSRGSLIVENCEVSSNGEAGISLDGTARAIITNSSIKDNDGWGIAARGTAAAVGWGNTVTGNQRDLFGVSDWLIKPRLASDQATIVVPGEIPTIEEAVYRVAEGGTIVIEPGDYSDARVAIYKRINLEGKGHDVVLGGITLFNGLGDVHVSNVAVVGDTNEVGILVPKGTHLQLEGSVVSNWRTGLHLLPGSTATVSNSTISENTTGIMDLASLLVLRGCSMSLNGEQAIDSASEELRIDECAIRDNGRDYDYAAIWFSGKSALIRNSIIEGNNNSGVEVRSGSCDIESCSISENGAGVGSGGTLVISGSRIMNNTVYGIYAWRGDLTVISTEVALNKYGVFLDDGGEDIEKLIAQNICIRDNSTADLRPSIEQYPWPAEFEECVQLNEVSEPPLIEGVYAEVTGAREATLSWTYPVDLELSQVVIRRKADSWPTDHTDGILVHEDLIPEAGSKAEYMDTDLVAGRTYYYAVFSSDSNENWNDRVEQGKNAAAVAIPTAMEDGFPSCVLQLRGKASRSVVTEVCVGTTFEIYVGSSDDDTGIEAVRFSSDDDQDGQSTGVWTEWYNWNESSGDWDSALRVKKWSFATGGQKEVWAEVKDTGDNVSQCSANIFAHPGYAIIVAGQGGWRDKRGLDHCANNAYRALRNLGFTDDHIFYLNSSRPQDVDEDGDDEVDAVALLSQFTDTLHEVRDRIGSNPIPLILYFAGHGAPDCFIFDEDNSEQGYLWVSNPTTMLGLHELLGEFQAETPVLAIIGSCYSGCFIASSEESPGSVSAANRIIITANHDTNWRILWGWARCSDTFWKDLMKGSSVKEAFANRTLPIDKRRLWLDDNGDAIGHPPHALETDGKLAAGTKIGVPGSDNLKLKPWAFYWIRSPGELRLYDSQGQVTGLVNGEVREEIPDSLYDEVNKIVSLFSPTDSYYCQVVGTDEGSYELDATSIENGTATTFTATDIPTIPGAVHRYTIDWNALARGEEGVVLQIDIDGEGTFEKTSQVGAELDGSILAVAEITPPQDGATNTWLWVILGMGVTSVLIIAVVVSVKWTNWRKSSKGH